MVNNLTAGSPRIDDTPFFTKSAFFKLYLFSIIILNHALNYEVYGLKDMEGAAAAILYWLERLEFNISWLSISMYFFISGYGFMLGFELSKTLDKWKRRIWTLLIPWLLWNTIMWLLGIAMESIPAIATRLNSGFGYELSLRSWLVDGLMRPADGPLWFMTNLIIVILLSPLVHILVKNKYVGLVAIAANFAAIYFTKSGRYSILMSLVFFMQAAWYARHLRHVVVMSYGRKARLAATAVLLVYLVIGLHPAINSGTIFHALTFSVTAPALWVAFGDVKLGEKGKKAEKYRFWLYAAHYLPLECIEKLWLIIGGVSVGAAWLGMIICPALTVILLVLASMLLEKLCYPLWCLLNGRKPRRRSAV